MNKIASVFKALGGPDGPETPVFKPANFDEFIGQANTKHNIDIAVRAAIQRGDAVGHILLHGPPGFGKSTLAQLIHQRMQEGLQTRVNLIETTGGQQQRPTQFFDIVMNLGDYDIVFIDEIHGMKSIIEEMWYQVLSEGYFTRTGTRYRVPNVTVIGATTKLARVVKPLSDRMVTYRLQPYTNKDIAMITYLTAKRMKMRRLTKPGLIRVAKGARNTPRLANRLIAQARDYMQVYNLTTLDLATADKAMRAQEIDSEGLNDLDRKYLRLLAQNGKAVGLKTIAHYLEDDINTIEDMYEPFLIRKRFITRGTRGRTITPTGIDYLRRSKAGLV